MFRRVFTAVAGESEYSVTVPPMDGALNPNNQLEQAAVVATADAPDNLCRLEHKLLFSSQGNLFELDPRAPQAVAKRRTAFGADVTALAAHADALAIALADGRILIQGGPHDGVALPSLGGRPMSGVTALTFAGADALFACVGSERHPVERWKHDLMERGSSGSVWRVDLKAKTETPLARRLAFPFGIVALPDGGVLVSESWRHQLLRISPGDAAPRSVLSDLPAYPSRIVDAPDGRGYWLALFAPRRQLTEFILREPAYLERMMRQIPPDYWVGPTLAPMASFLEPLQGGTLKKLAAIKPWAPSRSYGLVARLDADLQPVSSFHSRADGSRHGVMSAVEAAGRLFAASRGARVVVAVDLHEGE